MSDQPGIIAPGSYPMRDFRTATQENGQILNAASFPEVGGLTGPGKFPDKRHMRVEKPTSSRPARPVGESTSLS